MEKNGRRSNGYISLSVFSYCFMRWKRNNSTNTAGIYSLLSVFSYCFIKRSLNQHPIEFTIRVHSFSLFLLLLTRRSITLSRITSTDIIKAYLSVFSYCFILFLIVIFYTLNEFRDFQSFLIASCLYSLRTNFDNCTEKLFLSVFSYCFMSLRQRLSVWRVLMRTQPFSLFLLLRSLPPMRYPSPLNHS